MKNLKVNTDDKPWFKSYDEQFENILIYGNTSNCFGYYYEDGDIDCMSMEEKDRNNYAWFLAQVFKYKANIYIICNQNTIDYYRHMLKYIDSLEVDLSNVKLLKEGEKVDILEQFDEL